jgi:FAD/FMN-containing dehydrogenase/Fe-S oxidoreductase
MNPLAGFEAPSALGGSSGGSRPRSNGDSRRPFRVPRRTEPRIRRCPAVRVGTLGREPQEDPPITATLPGRAIDQADLTAFTARLRRTIGGEVRDDREVRALYASDASNYRVPPALVAMPATVDELAVTVALAAEAGVPLTMRGAGTSIAGNAIGPGLVVDVRRHLGGILELDPVAMTATVLPGTVLDAINAAAAPHGLRVGPDPSTHDRATVGGMVGNNACGSHSVRWGTTAENVLGLEVVTVDGVRRRLGALGPTAPGATEGPGPAIDARIRDLYARRGELIRRELPPWPRRVSGYALDWLLPERGADLARALAGTEGTCAVVSAVTLRLVRMPPAKGLLVLAFADDVAAAAAVPALLAERPLTVESLTPEVLGPEAAALAPRLGLPAGGAWLLVESGGDDVAEMRAHAARIAATLGTAPGRRDATLLEAPGAQQALWRVREDGAGRAARLPDGTPAWPGFEDAAVPPARLAAYLGELRALLRDQDLRGITYGHFGEGCIHLRVGFGLDRPGGTERLTAFLRAAADLVVSHGGTLSGEHGDGRARGALLGRQYSPAMLEAFRDWKAAWDPAGVLNPGIIVDPLPLEADLRRPRPTLIALDPGQAFEADGGDSRSAMERCIGVGKCVSDLGTGRLCPSYRATGEERESTRGRARLLQEMAAGSLANTGWQSGEVLGALDLCLSCRACLSDCPTGVDMATLKAEFLHHHYRGRRRPRAHYLLGRLPMWLRLARRIPGGPRLVNSVTGFAPTRRLGALVGGLAGERRIPVLARRTFVQQFRGRAPASSSAGSAAASSASLRRVVLWPDTFTNHLAPGVGVAAVRVLEAAGFDVAIPGDDVCCGLTWHTTGQLEGARRVLRATLAARGLHGEEPIVVLEPSCATMLRRDLVGLLPDEPRARDLAGRVTTLAELLDRVGWLPPTGAPVHAIVQPHCHQQAVLGDGADRRLMAAAGIDVDTTLTGCCGMAGNFGAEAGHEGITRAVAELGLLPALRAATEETAILADGFSCRTQVAFLDGRPARHLAEILAERLGPLGERLGPDGR